MRVFITGGTGLVGSWVVALLHRRSDTPVVLTRRWHWAEANFPRGVEVVKGDPTTGGDWEKHIEDCQAVVNLAGENIFATRWNQEVKQKIRDSRVRATENVVRAIAKATARPQVLVNASAIGYYGSREDEELTEESAPGDDLLAQFCVEWESAARQLASTNVRLVIVRIGVALSLEGGALVQMLTPFRMFVGGPVGSGRQWLSWIHIEDLAAILLHAIDTPAVSGVINGTAPEPVTNKQFSKALGSALRRPSFLRMPVFMLRLILGEVADVVSSSQRVLPQRTQELGYEYRFPVVDGALARLLGG